MIDLHSWPTPNGHETTMVLEEAGLDDTIKPTTIRAGDPLKPEFPAFSPNNRMPAIIDHEPADGGEPCSAQPAMTEQGEKLLSGQTAVSLARA